MTELRDSFTDEELQEMSAETKPSGYGSWSHVGLLLAGISDRLDRVTWAILATNGCKPEQPTPMRRPGAGTANVRQLDDLTLARLRRLRAGEVA